MQSRVVEDDFTARLETSAPYDLVCMDILLPEDGQTAVREMRCVPYEADRSQRSSEALGGVSSHLKQCGSPGSAAC